MGRCNIARWGLLFAFCVTAGCASSSRPGLLSWLPGRPAASSAGEKATKKSPWSSDSLAKSEPAPPPEAKTDKADNDQNASNPGDSAPGAAPGPEKIVTHDAATLQLIDWERQDADPAEREQLLADFKKVDAETVKLLLKQRRLYRQMGRSQSQPIMQAGGVAPQDGSPRDGAQFAAAEFPAAGSAPTASFADRNVAANPQHAPSAFPGGSPSPPSNFPAGASTSSANGYGQFPRDLPVYGSPEHSGNYGAQKTASEPQIPPIGLGFPHGDQRTNAAQAAHSSTPQMPVIDPLIGVPSTPVQGANFQNDPMTAQRSVSANLPQSPPGTPVGYGFGQVPNAAPSYAASEGATGRSPEWDAQLQQMISVAAREADAAHQALRAKLASGSSEPQSVQSLQRAHLEHQVNLRLLYLIAGQHERAVVAIPEIEPSDQEFWQQTFWGLANYFDTAAIPNDYDRATQTITQLRAAIMKLQSRANLEIRNASFCRRITSFGNYETFSVNDFRRRQPVLIYAEVANFHSELTRNNQYRTILRSTIEILDAAGRKVAEPIEFPATEDVCQNHRQDYFHSYEVLIPDNLALGPHVLKLTIQDELSQKIATYTLRFNVVEMQ